MVLVLRWFPGMVKQGKAGTGREAGPQGKKRNDRARLETAHSSRIDFYFASTQDLISILVEDREDDQISTPKEESRKTLGTSFILTGKPFQNLTRE
ncbi:hypothetical protein HGM15179_005045 [Zosterops borbonicus]|uniref:Uncharacterized protein n=1 Tax=Zosterops borbonicus TaxID=364589 RepID=A0A8K1LQF7_9PASS|nr:hypothetical protein HGM15179_005045 [Zosterops borbonicus]